MTLLLTKERRREETRKDDDDGRMSFRPWETDSWCLNIMADFKSRAHKFVRLLRHERGTRLRIPLVQTTDASMQHQITSLGNDDDDTRIRFASGSVVMANYQTSVRFLPQSMYFLDCPGWTNTSNF